MLLLQPELKDTRAKVNRENSILTKHELRKKRGREERREKRLQYEAAAPSLSSQPPFVPGGACLEVACPDALFS
jgi:hypothetical protein